MKFIGKLDLRSTYGLNVIAIHTLDVLNASPLASNTIDHGDKLIVMGENK